MLRREKVEEVFVCGVSEAEPITDIEVRMTFFTRLRGRQLTRIALVMNAATMEDMVMRGSKAFAEIAIGRPKPLRN